MNAFETSPARAHVRIPFAVDSEAYFTGEADVLTFAPAELVATKIRALHQRRKGRDLFDLWLALTELKLESAEILAAFTAYRPEHGYTKDSAIETFRGHLSDPAFRGDLDLLVATWPDGYDIDAAGQLIIEQLLTHL